MRIRCATLFSFFRFAALAGALAAATLAIAGCSKPAAANAGQQDQGRPGGQQQGAQGQGQAQGQAGAGGAQAAGGFGGAASAAGGGTGRRASATAVQATVVPGGRLVASRDTAGVVGPALQSQIAAGVGGIVSKALRQAGDWVEAGELIVALDDGSLRIAESNAEAALESATISMQTVQDSTSQSGVRLALQLDSAQASYDSAKRSYDSQKALFDLGGITASALDTSRSLLATAQANLENAKIALDQNQRGVATTPSQNLDALKIAIRTAENNLKQARLNLSNATIEAPFAGQLAAVAATVGMFLGQNASAFTLVGPERQVSFSIAPADSLEVVKGARLSFESGSRSFAIRVKQSPSIPVNGMIPLTASIEGASSLPFGTVGKISYAVPLATGTFVPIGSLGAVENRNYLFAIEGGKVTTKTVRVLATSGAIAAVEGIGAGTTVILSPPPGLVDGQLVQATLTTVPELVAAGGSAPAGGGRAAAAPSAAPGDAPGDRPGRPQGQPGQQGQAQGQQGQRGARAGAAGGTAAGAQAGAQAGQPPAIKP